MSHSVIISPVSVFTGQRITFDVEGLDVSGGECYDFGIIKDGMTVYGYEPGVSPFQQEIIGPVSLICASAWLRGDTDAILTVRAYIYQAGTRIDTAEAVFRLRKGGQVIPYTIDEDVAALPASGWLPKDTRRNNLYRLMLAYGLNIIKGPDGNPHFTALRASDAVDIDTDDIFMGGSVEHVRPYAAVSVLEHTYTALTDTNPVTLYDNTKDETPAVNKEVWFTQAPVIVETLTATAGLSIVIATENSAIVTGQGVLTGVPYTHTTQTAQREKTGGERGKTASVNDNTMVSVINGDNLVNRLFAFYCADQGIEKIRTELVYEKQRCGMIYRFQNPFGEEKTAFLASADLNASSFVRAACELIAGYVPAGQAGLYTHCILLDKATFAEDGGTFAVPEGVTSMKVVLIGGGTGGSSGLPGEPGKEARTYTNVADDADISSRWYGAEGGNGGDGGAGGTPGRVLSVVIENPASSYSYTIGDGGAGGAASSPGGTSNQGAAGTPSTFGGYASDGGSSYVPEAGVYDPINGNWFALKGRTGTPGGKGGARKVGADSYFAWTTDGEDVTGPDGTVYHGGKTGWPMTTVDGLPEARLTAYGGNGAGAAVGLDREDHPEMDGKSDQTATWEVVQDGLDI